MLPLYIAASVSVPILTVWIFEKKLPFKGYGMKSLMSRADSEPFQFSSTFEIGETQELLEGQSVGRMLPQTLATGATGIE